MKRIVLIILTFFSVFLFSCDEEKICCTPEPSWISKQYISCYVLPDTLEPVIQKETNSFCIALLFNGELILSGEDLFYTRHPLFDSISSLYNDNTWNRKSNYDNKAVAYTVNSIQIISDKDFDSFCPAGNNLIEKATVSAESWGDFVLNGYPEGQKDYLRYINKLFSDMSKAERSLWREGCRIYLPYPEQSGTYNFTITVTFEGGKTLRNTIEAELPSASSVTPLIRSDLEDSIRRKSI